MKSRTERIQLIQTHRSGPENEFRALKVLSAECYEGKEVPIFEREILTHLRHGDRHQLGYNHVCHILDDFEHRGPNGTHVCLVFELMGETLRSFGAWFAESRLPNSVMRRFTIQLLLVLDFAHEHNVIHTGMRMLSMCSGLVRCHYADILPILHQISNQITFSSSSGTIP